MITRQPFSEANELIQTSEGQSLLFNIIDMNKGTYDEPHQHVWHQILYPLKGMLKTQSDGVQFYIPHHRALFIPANTVHESWALNDTKLLGLYLKPNNKRKTPMTSRVLEVSNFFRELILHLNAGFVAQQEVSVEQYRLIDVLYDQIWLDQAIELQIPMPRDRRLTPIVNALLENPSNELTLKNWSIYVGASERTLSRLFKSEVGLSYPLWRQKLRLIVSLQLLEQNIPVQNAAHQVGYHSCSSYIEAFKQTFKFTPQQYKKNSHQLDFSYEQFKTP
ncbi:MAG: AraC-like DNA-binding protein/quercetin dioxygenase-like cupin family protein [Alteromonadaceae bacterium]|jgi:AraC-like DNA-binding protein/quercetin dioxygenase-like cupin family protein